MAFPNPPAEPNPQTREEELSCLQRKLDKRENEPGFADNAEAIKARIAEMESEAE